MASQKYSVEVRDQYGRLVTSITRPMKKEWAIYRNKAGSCQFQLDMFDPQATFGNFPLNQYDIVFRRYGSVMFAGQLSYIYPKIETNDQKTVDINAVGYFDLLQQRLINADFPDFDTAKRQVSFNSTDCGTVISDLISYTQFPLSQDGSILMQGTSPTLTQSFIASGSANVSTIKLLLSNTSATGNLIVGIYPDNNGIPGATPVTNSVKTLAVSGVSSSLSWYTITYSTKPVLATGTRYWIKAYLDTTQSGSNGIKWYYLNNDFYPSGRAYSPESPGLFTATQDLQFFIQLEDNSYQMTKNTYLGITTGTINTSFNISITIPEYKRIKDVIDEISKMQNGIDFNITTTIDSNNYMTKALNVFYPSQGILNTGLNFTYPGNIIKLDKGRDGKTMTNYQYSRGQGTGATQQVTTSYDTPSIQSYGLREEVVDYSDIPDSGTLQLLGDEEIRTHKDSLDVPNLVLDGSKNPQLGSFNLGDTILVQVTNAGLLTFTDAYRIEGLDTTIDEDDYEEITVSVSHA